MCGSMHAEQLLHSRSCCRGNCCPNQCEQGHTPRQLAAAYGPPSQDVSPYMSMLCRTYQCSLNLRMHAHACASAHAGLALIGQLPSLRELHCSCAEPGGDASLHALRAATGLTELVFRPQTPGPSISACGLRSLAQLTGLRRHARCLHACPLPALRPVQA